MAMKTVRAPMPRSKRAKQFQPFDCLVGLREAIAAKEKVPTPKRYLAEDKKEEIDRRLNSLKKGCMVTVVYYGADESDYLQLTGPVNKVDSYLHSLQIGNRAIIFDDIMDIMLMRAEKEPPDSSV